MVEEHSIRSKQGRVVDVKLTPLKAIRLHCLECMGWSWKEVELCTGKLCPLYPFRFGKNPSRAGIGNGKRGQLSAGFVNENRPEAVNEG